MAVLLFFKQKIACVESRASQCAGLAHCADTFVFGVLNVAGRTGRQRRLGCSRVWFTSASRNLRGSINKEQASPGSWIAALLGAWGLSNETWMCGGVWAWVQSVPELPARSATVCFPHCLAMLGAAELLELVVLPRTSPARPELDGRMENLKGKLLANVAFKGKEGETIRTGDRPVFWRVLHVVNNGSYWPLMPWRL